MLKISCDIVQLMKSFVIVIVTLNLLVFALGQGWFGTVRSDLGRHPEKLRTQLNAQAIQVTQASLERL